MKQLLSVKEVRKLLGVSRPTIYRLIDGGSFPKPIKMVGRIAWVDQEIEAWINQKIEERDVA